MYIYQLGWNWKHSESFAIERTDGHFGTQLLLIKTPAKVKIGENDFIIEPNTAIVIESCIPHCLYAYNGEYADDWIRFNPEKEDNEFINQLGLSLNRPIKLGDNSVSELIHACEEIFNSNVAQKNTSLDLILKAALTHISKYCQGTEKQQYSHYDESLDRIRQEIYASPEKDWNIPEIAKDLSLSSSHFQRLYKMRFGISCMKDVWSSRMEYAKQLLVSTNYTASEIAEMSGFQSYEYFSRSFVKYACISPAKYRKKFRE